MGKIALHKLPVRIEMKVDRKRDSGCWEWKGALSGGRYPQISYNGEQRYVHRLMHIIHNEFPSDDAPFVCHHCDNPCCVNPQHLFSGSHQDNIQDAANKGRVPTPQAGHSGEEHHKSKLTESDVVKMREIYATGDYTQAELCEEFPVKQAQVSSILRGEFWKDAGGPIL